MTQEFGEVYSSPEVDEERYVHAAAGSLSTRRTLPARVRTYDRPGQGGGSLNHGGQLLDLGGGGDRGLSACGSAWISGADAVLVLVVWVFIAGAAPSRHRLRDLDEEWEAAGVGFATTRPARDRRSADLDSRRRILSVLSGRARRPPRGDRRPSSGSRRGGGDAIVPAVVRGSGMLDDPRGDRGDTCTVSTCNGTHVREQRKS